MTTTIPSIASIGILGKNNNPLHIAVFPSYSPQPNTPPAPLRTTLQFSLLLSSCLDIFEARQNGTEVEQGRGNESLSEDKGLLCAVDERLSCWGWETNTGVRFVVVVDGRGRGVREGMAAGIGAWESGLKSVFKQLQAAYIRLLQNPFFDPDEHSPVNGKGGKKIGSKRFIEEVRVIGEGWMPGASSS